MVFEVGFDLLRRIVKTDAAHVWFANVEYNNMKQHEILNEYRLCFEWIIAFAGWIRALILLTPES